MDKEIKESLDRALYKRGELVVALREGMGITMMGDSSTTDDEIVKIATLLDDAQVLILLQTINK